MELYKGTFETSKARITSCAILLILKSGQRWSCCRNGCELGWYCCWMTLMGGTDWSFRSKCFFNQASGVHNYHMHLSGLWPCNLIHLLILIEWPNGNCILLKQVMPYVYCIHILYRKESITKTIPVSLCPCDSILLNTVATRINE